MEEFEWPRWMGDTPRASVPWSEAEDAEMVRCYRMGMTVSDIARRHGRKVTGIEMRLARALGENYKDAAPKQETEPTDVILDRLLTITESLAKRVIALEKRITV